MDWLPNEEGVDWFLEKVWPGLSEKHPDWRFSVAGRNMRPEFAERAARVPGVEVVGEVQDAVSFTNRHALLVVPLRSGGGMRVKLVEALALGKTVVSTPIGAEGLEARHGEHLILADSPEEFARCVEQCLTDRALFDRLGENGMAFVRGRYDNRTLAQGLSDWLVDLCRR
jgi:glycosyltransferase involved in cell wall biosynthesis